MSHENEHHEDCQVAIADARNFLKHKLPTNGNSIARATVFLARVVGGSVLSIAVVMVDIAEELKKLRKAVEKL